MFRRSESKPETSRTDTPNFTDRSTGRSWTGSDYDEARANGHTVHAPRTDHSTDQLGRTSS